MNINEVNKWKNRSIAFLFDTLATVIALSGANWLSSTYIFKKLSFSTLLSLTVIQCGIYILMGLYRGIWRFASIPDLIRIVRAVFLGTVLNMIIVLYEFHDLRQHFSLSYALLLICLLSGARLLYRWSKDYNNYFLTGKRILIIGAGSASDSLIRDLRRSFPIYKYKPIALVDDALHRQGCEMQGIRVLGTTADIPSIVLKKKIQLILIAIPSATSNQMRNIVRLCEESKVPFKTLPGLKGITDYNVKTSILREIQLEDLLGREEISHDLNIIKPTIMNNTILVTGGGGSIGSELCRQISLFSPKNLIIVDKSEFNLYAIDLELKDKLPHTKIHLYLCSVTDRLQMQKIYKQHRPELVFHVAAYKHVPLLETHIQTAMYNNIIGTKITAELADEFGVKSFVLISTDKAVNPTNIMGSTKRAAEIFCQTINHVSKTRFITVRFGNVLDSTGSVIPLFRKQIAMGGPVTVTHPDICRYFMTIPEAAQLILQAASMNNEGDIFVLDMGEPIKIKYLAEQMIKLSGNKLGTDIRIIYTGLRPGEKLYEELFHENESLHTTSHPRIRQARVRNYDFIILNKVMNEINNACLAQDEDKLKTLLLTLVPEYQPKIEQTFYVKPNKEHEFHYKNDTVQ